MARTREQILRDDEAGLEVTVAHTPGGGVRVSIELAGREQAAPQFIPIDEAARRAGVVKGHLSRVCRVTLEKRGLAEMRPPRGGKGKKVWWVREDVAVKLPRSRGEVR